MPDIEKILSENNNVLAIICKTNEITGKSNFITPNDFGFQIVVQNSNEGQYWKPHRHLPFENLSYLSAQEFIYVIKGKIEIGIYSEYDKKVADRILNVGDSGILNSGHDIKSLEHNTKFLAIKQGPYREGEKILIK